MTGVAEPQRPLQPVGQACGGGIWRRLPFLLVLALCTVTVAAVPAQSGATPEVRVSLVADSHEITVGDLVTISLIVSHPESYAVVVPRLEREWGPFEVQAQTTVQTVSVADGVRTVAKQFRVTLFAPGSFETPDLPVSIRGPDGTVAQVSPVPAQFTVTSVLTSPDDELKDLRPPADLSTPFWQRPIVIVLTVVAAVAVVGGISLFLYRRSRMAVEPPEAARDTRSPWEVATQELDRIVRLELPGRGETKQHYTLVAAALRTYLGATYLREGDGRSASEMSTEEIATGIQGSTLDHGNARLVIELLEEADLAKFANFEPAPERAMEALSQARNFVSATRPAVATSLGSAPAMQGAAP